MALAEFAVVFLQIDPLSSMPLFFFAATLLFIGFDLIAEWLVSAPNTHVRTQCAPNSKMPTSFIIFF